MSLATSGPISIGGTDPARSINAQFGRASNAQTSMSHLYRGGGIVPNASQNNNVPTSGPISLSNFYGAVNRVPVTITLASNQTNYVLNTAQVPGYVAGLTDVTLVINGGIFVSSNNTGTPALDVPNVFAAGDTISIVNNGTIVGMGGNGGRGTNFSLFTGTAGAVGGLALRAQRPIVVTNNGTIGGGGGGGGGGRAAATADVSYAGGGGGGGRSGTSNSLGGSGGEAAGGQTTGAAGGGGTTSGPGTGGSRSVELSRGGGNGGQYGASGEGGQSGPAAGTTTIQPATAGGSGGAAVNGNANITWVATGTRLGAIT